MIITNSVFKSNLTEYSNKNTKLFIDIRDDKLFKYVNGLYETNSNISRKYLWPIIYFI